MRPQPRPKAPRHEAVVIVRRALGGLAWISFGLLLLAYLVAIDRQDWFVLKPMTGASVALSLASEKPAES
jgi:hypothetical protein